MPSRYDENEDEDYDDRPRKKKRKSQKKSGAPVGLLIALGVGFVLAVGAAIGGYFLFAKKGSGPLAGGGLLGGARDSAPAGYTAVRDPDGGFAVALPGVANKARTSVDGQPVDSKTKAVWASIVDNGDSGTWVTSFPLPAGYNPGSSPEQMEKLLRIGQGGIDAPWNEIVSKGPVTLDGKPAFELRYRYKPDWQAAQGVDIPGGRGGGADMSRREQTIVCATTDGKRIYVIKFDRKGQMPDDETVKTVYGSFKFV